MSVSKSSLPALRILIVDDDLEVSASVAEMVKHLGYDSCISHHAEVAHRVLQAEKVDLILVDYRMPDLTGLDLVFMLKGENCPIPVIMMTGYSQAEERIVAEGHGEFTILKKPLSILSLKVAIEESLATVRAKLQ